MKIDKEQLKEEFESISAFLYVIHTDEWMKYCKEHRNNNQSLENLSCLIQSITSARPWRWVLDQNDKSRINRAILELSEALGVYIE